LTLLRIGSTGPYWQISLCSKRKICLSVAFPRPRTPILDFQGLKRFKPIQVKVPLNSHPVATQRTAGEPKSSYRKSGAKH